MKLNKHDSVNDLIIHTMIDRKYEIKNNWIQNN